MSTEAGESLRHLDFENARRILAQIEATRGKEGGINPHLTDIRNMCLWPGDVTFAKTEWPGAWRIVRVTADGTEELVFRLHGIVLNKLLPPQRNPVGKSSPRYLTQSITLGGLGLAYFDDAADAIMQIDARLGQRAGYEQMDACAIVKKIESRDNTVNISNRYFTARKYATHLETLPIPKSIDPKGFLERAAGKMYAYMAENVVQYERRMVYADGEERYETAEPQEIVAGCIVDVQMSFMAVQTDGMNERFKTIAVLRVITILDDTLARSVMIPAAREVANRSVDRNLNPEKGGLVLKRRNGNVPGLYRNNEKANRRPGESKRTEEMAVDRQEAGERTTENDNGGMMKKQKKD
ncbi:hypothetical protein V5O48_005249 [Marasmius crinis-equi]|uniref:Uncharacterized protein n=1 Tax=Marasmius crinis-equi TaxID=585013 RepID=A0ABR3FN76_9AGAR